MKHIQEELLIDYALNILPEEKRSQINNHLSHCEQCRQNLISWKRLTAGGTESIYPSETLHERVMESIQTKSIKDKRIRPKPIFTAASIAAIIMLVVGLYQLNQQQPMTESDSYEYVTAQHEQIPEQFLTNPDTNRLDIIPVTINRNVKGDVWLNEVTNELILQVDGLTPLQSHDYQVWLVHDNNVWNDELLRFKDGRIQVYYRVPDVKTVRYIKVSIEPMGGSPTPTGPETLFIDLHQ